LSAVAGDPTDAPHIVLVAGETSGDNLGAQLIEALRVRLPHARFSGIAGPRMIAAGCEVWERAENLSVMGLFEILPELPRLLRIRRDLVQRVMSARPAVYVGVDFKEFNLSVARSLKSAGICTVQYVSPQVWAWREGRAKKIGRAVDLLLCLLPFEETFYAKYAVNAHFVGHPLADQIPLDWDVAAARTALEVPSGPATVAILPGSRGGEVSRLGPDFAATVAWLLARRSTLQFIAPMATPAVRAVFEKNLRDAGVFDCVRLFDGRSREVIAASDVVLLASGTATLEATLIKRPMVVAYRLAALTSFVLKELGMMKAPFFAQPNLLAGRKIVPEFFNNDVRPDVLGPALLEQLDRGDLATLRETFTQIHLSMRRDASARAAEEIVELLRSGCRVTGDGPRLRAETRYS
jgi:lipid-A-disaccharide synthase